MEARKPVESFSASSSSASSSSSSLSVFSGKESSLSGMSAGTSSSSTTGIFSSVFPPPSAILGRNSFHSGALGSLGKHGSEFQIGDTKHASADGVNKIGDSINRNVTSEETNSVYSDQAAEACFLSSSLFYGGRDHCAQSSDAQGSVTPQYHHKYEKDGEEDDLNSSDIASRGNWWQGSLYY